jgi:hypothetical protein
MKMFLALAVLSLATSVTTQAASSFHDSEISSVTAGGSGIIRFPRPKLHVIADDTATKRQPPRVTVGSVDGSDLISLRPRPPFTTAEVTNLSRTPSRPKLREGNNARKPHFSGSELIAAQSRPKPPGATV